MVLWATRGFEQPEALPRSQGLPKTPVRELIRAVKGPFGTLASADIGAPNGAARDLPPTNMGATCLRTLSAPSSN